MTKPLELILVTNKPSEVIVRNTRLFVEDAVGGTVTVTSEDTLISGQMNDGTPLPSHALLYVHGNFADGYQNIGRARELIGNRPDLYAIVEVDGARLWEEHFANPEDCTFARSRVWKGTPLDQPLPHLDVVGLPAVLMREGKEDSRTLLERYWDQIRQDREGATTSSVKPVDIVVYNDKLGDQHFLHMVEDGIEVTMLELGLGYEAHFPPESLLERGMIDEGVPIPKNALVYVHGNVRDKHQTIGYVRRIAEERPDLKFILSVDLERIGEKHFKNPSDYQFVCRNVTNTLNPAQQVVVSPYNVLGFFSSAPDPLSPSTKVDDFKAYMTQLKALRGEE